MTRRSGDWAPVSIISIWAELPQSPAPPPLAPAALRPPLTSQQAYNTEVHKKKKMEQKDQNIEKAQTTPLL